MNLEIGFIPACFSCTKKSDVSVCGECGARWVCGEPQSCDYAPDGVNCGARPPYVPSVVMAIVVVAFMVFFPFLVFCFVVFVVFFVVFPRMFVVVFPVVITIVYVAVVAGID